MGENEDFSDQPDGEYLQPEDEKKDPDQEQRPAAQLHPKEQSSDDKVGCDCDPRAKNCCAGQPEKSQRFLGELYEEENRQ